MTTTKALVYLGLIFVILRTDIVSGNDYLPTAQDVTWSSNNFKTLLTWKLRPTNYTYTVELFGASKDGERNPNCIQSTNTECDLTDMLTEFKNTYYADVLSEPLPGKNFDLVEFPHARSKKFCPYTDTLIGRPDFTIKVNDTKMTLYITDPLSAVYHEERLLSIRDIFKDDLKYRVIYRKAKSTGRKTEISDTNQIEVEVDRGESYCFNVQAYIASRRGKKKLGMLSRIRCSEAQDKSIIDEYGIPMLAIIGVLILVFIISTVSLIVACCKCHQRAIHKAKGQPLENV